MTGRSLLSTILAVTALGAGPTACNGESPMFRTGQEPTLSIDEVFGRWTLSPASVDVKGSCDLALSGPKDGLGERVVLVERCGLPQAMSAKRWRLSDRGFDLLDEDGAVLLRFSRVAIDDFRTLDGLYRLTRTPMA